MRPRIGFGYDVHQLAEGRKLIMCGVEIPYEKGLLGHSDADVALHALTDALLGAAAMGDIGTLFPDSDSQFKNIDSRIMLRESFGRIRDKGFHFGNADVTIVAQAPKMRPFIEEMRANISNDLQCPKDDVSVKATTTEHLGFTGRKEGIAAYASVILFQD